MAESRTSERASERAAERNTEQMFNRAEDTMSTLMDNNRRTFQAMLEYNRNSLNTGYQMLRTMQEESIRLTDAWLNQMSQFQKNTMKSFQDYSHQFQDYTQKTMQENQNRMEETVDQSMELVTPGARRTAGRR